MVITAGLFCSCAQRQPDIVLITIDTLRADRLGTYGYEGGTSPNIDALAAKSAVFENASTAITRTTQSFATIFTGRSPNEHRVLEIGQRLHEDEITLAEILRNQGYRTVGISANPVAGKLQGLDQGFEIFIERQDLAQKHGLSRPLTGPVPAGIGPAEAVTLEALKALTADDDQPLFLWLLYMDPHWDYNPPSPYNEVVDWQSFDFYKRMRHFAAGKAAIFFNLNGEAAKVLPEISKLYDAEIRYSDEMVGRVLSAIKPGALVVLTSDHGESLGEHGYFYQHGALVYQATQHIPLIVHQKEKIAEGVRISEAMSTLDLAPTILGQLGIKTADQMNAKFSGTDLSSILRDPDVGAGAAADTRIKPRVILSESGASAYPENSIRKIGGRRSDDSLSIRDGRWVLIVKGDEVNLYDTSIHEDFDTPITGDHAELITARLLEGIDRRQFDPGRWRSARLGKWKLIRIPEAGRIRYELYDLSLDPHEENDLSNNHPEVMAPLAALLDRAAEASVIDEQQRAAEFKNQDQIENQLRALGYIE